MEQAKDRALQIAESMPARMSLITESLQVAVSTLGNIQVELHLLSESSPAELAHLQDMADFGLKEVQRILKNYKTEVSK